MIEIIYSNFGFWINLLIPITVAIYLTITNKEYIYKELIIQIIATFTYLSLIFLLLFSTTTDLIDTQYFNGKAKKIEFYEEWTELRVHTESYECGSSDNHKTCTRTVTEHIHHPKKWHILTTNDEKIKITKDEYKKAKLDFGVKKEYISRINKISTGDGNKYVATPNIIIPTSVAHTYINYVTAAKDNVIHTKISKDDMKLFISENKLHKYPPLSKDKYGAKKLLRIIDDSNRSDAQSMQDKLDLFCAKYSKTKQVNPLIYITKQDRSFKTYLETYWNKGKKNDATLILGVDANGKVLYSDVIAWTNNTDFIVDCQNSFKGLNVKNDAIKLVDIFQNLILSEYERKPMEEFSYLKENITLQWYWQLLIILGNLVISYMITRYFLTNKTLKRDKSKSTEL